jgi:hypothetical protein
MAHKSGRAIADGFRRTVPECLLLAFVNPVFLRILMYLILSLDILWSPFLLLALIRLSPVRAAACQVFGQSKNNRKYRFIQIPDSLIVVDGCIEAVALRRVIVTEKVCQA